MFIQISIYHFFVCLFFSFFTSLNYLIFLGHFNSSIFFNFINRIILSVVFQIQSAKQQSALSEKKWRSCWKQVFIMLVKMPWQQTIKRNVIWELLQIEA